jgi:hypothetical protein
VNLPKDSYTRMPIDQQSMQAKELHKKIMQQNLPTKFNRKR